ncbi:MAG TPA: F0F1 ATP synthase subunit B [Kiritimatiellia bacterium]|nr:F0F1 ATP synthase subunit B [Kiritimatiellia bacterium]HMO99677.1 F0F1 ATP synthase subunit B [Kiritimatiellia bacterium]
MDDATPITTAEIPVESAPASGAKNVIDVSGSMMVMTYLTFALTALILYKVAWKPILAALDKREGAIRQSLDNAERLEKEMAEIEQTRARILEEAEAKARDLIDKGRRAAADAAHAIETKAREESQILVENARREIRAESDKAMADLRRESAALAVDISRKILQDNLDEPRSRDLADRMISQL